MAGLNDPCASLFGGGLENVRRLFDRAVTAPKAVGIGERRLTIFVVWGVDDALSMVGDVPSGIRNAHFESPPRPDLLTEETEAGEFIEGAIIQHRPPSLARCAGEGYRSGD
jgi:hypothetical protein